MGIFRFSLDSRLLVNDLTKRFILPIAIAIIAAGLVDAENLPDMRPALVGSGPNADAAIEIMRQWVFLPAYRNGKPVDSTTHEKFYFVTAFYRMQ
jgi:hypothetical protein